MAKLVFLWAMALLYLLAGANHFANPGFYVKIMPPWIPWHFSIVYITGVMEILLAIFILPESTRNISLYLLIAFLICIFPANIQMSLNFYQQGNPNFWATIARLPLQPLLIWWAWKMRI